MCLEEIRAPCYLVINVHENQALLVLRHGLTMLPSLTLNKLAQEIFLLQNAKSVHGCHYARLQSSVCETSLFFFFFFASLRGDLM